MTDDPKQSSERLKVKRISDGAIVFMVKDEDFPYEVGDLFVRQVDRGVFGTTDEKYIVIEDIKK